MGLGVRGRETGLGDHRKIDGMPRPGLAAKAGAVPPVPRVIDYSTLTQFGFLSVRFFTAFHLIQRWPVR